MTDYEKLKNIIEQAERLLQKNITSGDSEFQAWKTKASRFLINKFGDNSFEYDKFNKTLFSLPIYTLNTPNSSFVVACKSGLEDSIAIFKTYLEEMEESTEIKRNERNNFDTSKVFIVHGHDGELKQEVARLIEKQDIEAIILSEQANKGRTIIEKFEDYSDVGGAICLFTADDIGKAKNDSNENPRARQNVVFEAGYFIGKLGRARVIILADNGIEMPSDLGGVLYTNSKDWKVDLCKELKAMGFNIDFNKLF